jgi:hypothetical protein
MPAEIAATQEVSTRIQLQHSVEHYEPAYA